MSKRTNRGFACLTLLAWAASVLFLIPLHLAMEPHEGDSTGPLQLEARGHDHEGPNGQDHNHESEPDSQARHHYTEHDTKLRRSATVPVAPVILSTIAVDEAAHDLVMQLALPVAASAEPTSPPITPVKPRAPPTAA